MKHLIIDKLNNTLIVKLNRPEVFNSFNKEMGEEFLQTLLNSSENNEIRAILITGTGKAFSAGQDLSEVIPDDNTMADLGEILETRYNKIIKLIRNIEKPVIAAVNGVAAGAGANIALSCDIVVASSKASFVQAFSKIGLVPDSGGTFFLPRIIGLQKASALIMLGENINAEEAERIGMIYKVFPENEFEKMSLELADRLAQMPTKGLGFTKKLLNQSFNNSLEDQLEIEKEYQIKAGKTYDYAEGVKAFKEKRKPVFKGE
ncbi:MAG: enoyl-CoA hydratase/isomerase family protein [Melioribacteraceae bacterium]|nr:enoyl-CoA hydratase/isomerase family protein [Melioribacteraceae bacterium]MCO6474937.1 enoyl-CoA hydratase/isomerase family protein [Melioribacteraceae bacterium]MDD3558210.1 enoyl-CoA hydratase-related protein [Melioribacteraceae bacterium]